MGDITVVVIHATQVAFKSCVPFIKSITKFDRTIIDDAEYLDLVMSMYNLLEYSSNYSYTRGSLWFYCKDEASNSINDIEISDEFKYFKCKVSYWGTQWLNLLQIKLMES